MKAEIGVDVYCPKCYCPMSEEGEYGNGTYQCIEYSCELLNVKFKAPTVELERVECPTQ